MYTEEEAVGPAFWQPTIFSGFCMFRMVVHSKHSNLLSMYMHTYDIHIRTCTHTHVQKHVCTLSAIQAASFPSTAGSPPPFLPAQGRLSFRWMLEEAYISGL